MHGKARVVKRGVELFQRLPHIRELEPIGVNYRIGQRIFELPSEDPFAGRLKIKNRISAVANTRIIAKIETMLNILEALNRSR